MKINKIFFCILVFFLIEINIKADNTYFIDFNKVLNQSTAGAEAQEKLKKKLLDENKKFENEEENLRKEEKELISQKKILSNEEYKKKVDSLRKKFSDLQNKKQKSLTDLANARSNARKKLIDALNPIMKNYMDENKIRLIIDKKNVILGDTALEITDKIIELLNQKLKSINFN